MALAITRGKQPLPPRIFLYGVAGIGKTTLGASIPGGVILPTEEGSDSLDCARLPQAKSLADVYQVIGDLSNEKHDFRTLVIDSVTALEPLIWAAVCAEAKVKSIEALGFGKGYVQAAEQWRLLLDGLSHLRKERGMQIVLLGHVEVKTVNAPDSDGYDRYQPRLHKTAMSMLVEWSDALLFANYKKHLVGEEKKRAVGSGERCLKTSERPSHLAKNRYNMPEEIPLTWAAIEQSITQAFA